MALVAAAAKGVRKEEEKQEEGRVRGIVRGMGSGRDIGRGRVVGGGGVQRGNDNYVKGAGPVQLGRLIGLYGRGNNTGDIDVQIQDQTHGRRFHPPPGIVIV